MMFLIKVAFWLSLVLILLPTGSRQPDAPQIKVGDAASVAVTAVSDLSGFCSRQPNACAAGSQIMAMLVQRLQAGATMVIAFASGRATGAADTHAVETAAQTPAPEPPDPQVPEPTGSIAFDVPPAAHPAALPRPRPQRTLDTLSATDRQPAWRPPAPVREARLGGAN